MIPICLLTHVVCLKKGSDMWEKSDAIAEIRSGGISAPHIIKKQANASHLRVGGEMVEISNVTI